MTTVTSKAPSGLRRPVASRFVPRVIGLPGDTVVVSSSGLHLNGDPVPEPYVHAGTPTAPKLGSWDVAPGTYFLMGDNRALSCDSRAYGGVPEKNILGQVTEIKRGSRSIDVA